MYRFIENIGDFFNPGYYNEDFSKKVFDIYEKNASGEYEGIPELNARFSKLKGEYYKVKTRMKELRLHRKYIIKETHDFNSLVMEALGYDTSPAYANWIHVDEHSVIPARSILYSGNQARLVVLEMQAMIKINDDDVPPGLFEQYYSDEEKVVKEQKYDLKHWDKVITKPIPEGCKISPSKINECVSTIFLHPDEDQRPKYIIVFAGNIIYLMEQDKWDHGSYLKFDLEELFTEVALAANKNYYALFYLLASKETLAKDGEIVLMDQIDSESFKNAYEVTKDLKEGVISAVKKLADEAIHYKREVLHDDFDETQETFASDVKDDCLSIIYRLLFIFYAEARPEIGILPMDDEAYAKGYSLEILRDLEQTPLKSKASQDSYFFHDSLWALFDLIREGYNEDKAQFLSFKVKKIDSPLFDDNKFKALKWVKYRNKVWQEIICDLSLSKEQAKKRRGRISYANLGVNQLGSVYESLLAYRGFYAEEDYIEVHKKDDFEETYLVPRSRIDDFEDDEILRDKNGDLVLLKKGSFDYRLNGRDRKKSASYYTPEVLTKSTVKYTLMAYKEKLEHHEMKAEELLEMKILEPAMGAAAFQNEVINQMAELYLTYRQQELGKRIPPQNYQDERQKVKAYIATKNIYGVDLNPTAIELGKLALWLNVMHKDMETPFFAHRLALGNAVIGAWFKAYNSEELYKRGKRINTYECTEWWEKAPHRLHFNKGTRKIQRKPSEIYHFLLPDKNMLAALQIREEKLAHPAEARVMQNKIRDWTKAITYEELVRLKSISCKIDKLITECINYQDKIEKLTGNNYKVWGHNAYVNAALFSYIDKEAVTKTRLATSSAYRKLVAVMDYWCALWFWDYEDAGTIPTREEFWTDIEFYLGVDLSSGAIKSTTDDTLVLTSGEEPDLFNQELFAQETELVPAAEQESEVEYIVEHSEVTYTKEDAAKMIASVSGQGTLFSNPRSSIVEKLSSKYHFFHPMLEFIEVFWLRDGFDVIVGNPPWIKLEFDEKDIISDIFPEVAIRKVSAPKVREMKAEMFSQSVSLKSLYLFEQAENTCNVAFMNAPCNYPLLIGQQTNLYKSILENSFSLVSRHGYIGLLHPETVYDDPKGEALRQELYHRLNYHFQYRNEYSLFSDVGHTRTYSTNIYGGYKDDISFMSIHNLFTPDTIDAIVTHDGYGECPGIKINGNWCSLGHKNRMVHITEAELTILSKVFENRTNIQGTRLVSIHSIDVIDILKKFSIFPHHLRDFPVVISEGLHETNAVDDGIMEEKTVYPNNYNELILNGVHIYVSSPLYQNPQSICKKSSQYDIIDLNLVSESFKPRTNFVPVDTLKYNEYIKGFIIHSDDNEIECYDNWIDYYKVGMRKMLDPGMERTLIPAIISPLVSHTNGIISSIFKDTSLVVELTGLLSSLVLDFFIKTASSQNMTSGRFGTLPLGISDKFKSALFSRTLLLNCITSNYASLWHEEWRDSFKDEEWSISDHRLRPFNSLNIDWNKETPLRSFYERRQALVEIDVISALSLGLNLHDLEMIYSIQFPVLQQNEEDTWYDQKGNIVFTTSKGLAGIGLSRTQWQHIRGTLSEDGRVYYGTSDLHTHIIARTKSELYGGQQVTYYAPYTKCDRIEDYRRAWAHFEKVFNENK